MAINCIPRQNAEKLKNAFKSGEISFSKLYQLGSTSARVNLLKEYVGDSAKELNIKIEKAILAPNQKQAIKKILEQDVLQKGQIYKMLSLSEVKSMRDNLTIKQLSEISRENRIKEFTKYTDEDRAVKLNEKFEYFKKKGDLSQFEKRVLGTELLKEEKRLKGDFARLEVLNDIGLLNPAQLNNFMRGLVESELGTKITYEESKKLSKYIEKESLAFDKLKESEVWNSNNNKGVKAYKFAQSDLIKYTKSLSEKPDIGNAIIEIGRANILSSHFTAINSALYQTPATLETAISSALTPATLGQKGSFKNKMIAIKETFNMSKEQLDFVLNEVKMGVEIYDKTNMDTSRSYILGDSYSYFGEKEKTKAISLIDIKKDFKRMGESIKNSKGINKLYQTLKGYKEIVALGPKYMAGGTDTLVAQSIRAITSWNSAKQIAKYESLENNLPKGMTEEQRFKQLLNDSYNPFIRSGKEQVIRNRGIRDAHNSNNTQKESLADGSVAIRDKLKIPEKIPFVGGLKVGRNIIPFLKITTTAASKAIQAASGIGVVKEVGKIVNGLNSIAENEKMNMKNWKGNLKEIKNELVNIFNTKKDTELEAISKINESTANLLGYMGIFGVGLLVSLFLDDDDYIPPYAILKNDSSAYEIAKAQNATGGGYIRIGGKWIPLKYLVGLNVVVGSIMFGRQAKVADGESFLFNYFRGMQAEVLGLPIIDNIYRFFEKSARTINSKNMAEYLEDRGLKGKDAWEYAKIRTIPSMLSRDLYNAIFTKDKYDFLGQEVEGGKPFKDDKTTDLILEFRRLDNAGFMPTISKPTGVYAKELETKMGEKDYKEYLAGLQNAYKEETESMITKDWYKGKTDKIKKEEFDDKRQTLILDKLKKENNK